MIKVGVIGACGRMGKTVAQAIENQTDLVLAVGIETPGHPDLGKPFGKGKLEQEISSVLDGVDVMVDFSVRTGLAERVGKSAQAGKAYICGVTGLRDEQMDSLSAAGKRIPVVYAPNFSVGVNVLYRLAAEAAKLLGSEYDVEVLDTPHRKKQDAPSGTAKRLVQLVQDPVEKGTVAYGRHGQVGPKSLREIGVHSIRTGDVVGEHTVVFGGPSERLELTHRAGARSVFAHGVVRAIRFAHGKEPGFYTMAHVLGLIHH